MSTTDISPPNLIKPSIIERITTTQSTNTVNPGPGTSTAGSTPVHDGDQSPPTRPPTRPATPPRKKLDSFERKVRPSQLDICDPNSEVSRSSFRGLCVFVHVLSAMYIIANPFWSKLEKGYLWEPSMVKAVFSPFFHLMGVWACNFIWSSTAYGLVESYRRGLLTKKTVFVIKHLNQCLLLLLTSSIIRSQDWAVFPSTFALSVSMIHYMKMHSYTTTALELLLAKNEKFLRLYGLKDFFHFILTPVLVYDLDQPVAPHPFRPIYFCRKMLHLVVSLSLIFIVSTTMVIPVFELSGRYNLLHTYARLLIPMFLMNFLFFYMMFECVMNLLAEMTSFGDRMFYGDWWNCTSWEELARKWNKPVHEFLLRHIYVPYYKKQNDRLLASAFTFMFSALLHEFFLAVTLGVVRPWMSVFMMCQLPLIALSKFHRSTVLGNYYFWIGLGLGEPLLFAIYGRSWAERGLNASR